MGPDFSAFDPSDAEYAQFVKASLGSRYDPKEKKMRDDMTDGEAMGVVLSGGQGFHPIPVVLTREDVAHYLKVGEKSEFIQVASSGEVPLLVAPKRDTGHQGDVKNAAASWLMLDPQQGWEFPIDKWTEDNVGDVILLRSDAQDFVCGDAAFCYDFASNMLQLFEEGQTPDPVKTWKLHQRVKKHSFK